MFVDEDVADFLEHHGVRGMKWGVRRARRIQRMADAGVKGGSKAAKIRAIGGRLGPIDLVKGHGITGGARRKAKREGDREKRLAAGKAGAKDILMHYGSTRPHDLIPVRSKNVGKKTIMDNHKAIVAAGGALFVAQFLAKRAMKNG